ncbi:MAG: Methionine--tRNA ligase [Candidatus Methanofastidiosum methylothiophilum]|uniref:Methionine--tRNA ligase n=1 Tax=Candidatus Methanofastidiosum methylothiophilum TaxID=1705564 RepID=A0A150IP86_9EURY|nr:MAG: Methionine--tRNA ligase [Candidatus Methanofastidiosum methylthiophilus]KYC46698.1 MAG: Methionine--tRNA ligase [Candidatus Methanofastidiosum methylthiophilus]KYC49138.1 MAG: Methionine--tRNA ligase [Candidatus Methanofastidiosum methylthiophilus]
MRERILVTSALPYANGPLHVGHIAGAYLPADTYVRYNRLAGADIIYVGGTDEHGTAIEIKALKDGVTPKELVDFYYEDMKTDFKNLGISYDNFSRTSLPVHHKTSQDFFLKILKNGHIERKTVTQAYCPKCAMFLADRYVEGTCPACSAPDQKGNQCEVCGKVLEPIELVDPKCITCSTTPEVKETFQWFIKLSDFQDELEVWMKSNKHWRPNVVNFCLNWIKEGLQDRAITRDLQWGIKVPLEEGKDKVLYVWFEAVIGYVSSTKEWAEKQGKPDAWKDYWLDGKIVHFIGKDNIPFHAIMWPAFLLGYGEYEGRKWKLPYDVPANEYLNIGGKKTSTSRNWAIWLGEFLKDFPPDYLRYYLTTVAPESKDSDFLWEEFQKRINDELNDIIGNFVHRSITFAYNNFDGKIPSLDKSLLDDDDREAIKSMEQIGSKVGGLIKIFKMKDALKEVVSFAKSCNRYFDKKEPWKLVKTDKAKAANTIYISLELAKTLSMILNPFLPFSTEKMLKDIGIEKFVWDDSAKLLLKQGNPLGKPEPVFSKVPDEEIKRQIQKLDNPAPMKKTLVKKEEKPMIPFDEFAKLDIRTGKIVSVEDHPKADKLYVMKIDVGEERTIVAGIKSYYKKEELIGKKIVAICNLEPATIRGVKSEAMILAADDGKLVSLLEADKEIKTGAKIR